MTDATKNAHHWHWINREIGVEIVQSPAGKPPIEVHAPPTIYLTHLEARALGMGLLMIASLCEPESSK